MNKKNPIEPSLFMGFSSLKHYCVLDRIPDREIEAITVSSIMLILK